MSELAAEAQFLSPGFRTPFNMPSRFNGGGPMQSQQHSLPHGHDEDMNMEITTAFENCNVGATADDGHRL